MRLLVPILVLLITSFALAADVSGKWTGSLEFKGEGGQTHTAPAHADLKQQNVALTGRIWKGDGQQFEIEQGKVRGTEVSFQFRAPEGADEQVVVHAVKLSLVTPTQLQGTLQFATAGQKMSGKLTFTKGK